MITQQTISPRAWFLMLMLAFIWGGSFLSNRVALDEIGVFTTVAFRVTGAMLVMWGVVAVRGHPVPRNLRIWAGFVAIGFSNTALPFSLIVWGQQHIASGLASILNASTAIFGVLVAALVFRDERLTLRKGAGVALGFLGVITAIGVETLERFDLTSAGQLAVIAAAMSYACAAALARVVLRGVRPEVAAAGMLTGSALVMLPAALLLEGVPTFGYAPQTWAALAYLAFFASAVAYLMYFAVLGMAGAGNLSLVTLMVAPVAIVLGAVVLGESLPRHAYGGFALLAAGMLMIDGRLPAWTLARLARRDAG